MNRKPTLLRLATGLLLHAAMLGSVGAATITREFTAAWFDPGRPGHGLGLEVIDSAAGKQLLAYWFTYDTDGSQLWLYGTGPIDGDSAQVTVYRTQGGAYTGDFNPSQVVQQAWGTLEISFSDCNNGSLRYVPNAPGSQSGSMPLSRSTRLFNGNCSGGVSDDRQVGSNDTELVSFLSNVGAPSGASAKIKFEERANRTEFSIELEDLPVGNYTLQVDGADRGTIAVATRTNGTHGELEFRSPPEPGKRLLDFDPRDVDISVRDAAGLLFMGSLGSSAGSPGVGNPPGASGSVPRGNAEYFLHIEPTGNDGPELKARLQQRADRVDFSVELEDVPAGDYVLRIGGTQRGTITVRSVTGGTEGELEFRDPVEAGKLLLDFDPRGQVISAERNGNVLSGTLPNTPTGVPGSGDDGGNGGGGGGTTNPSPGVVSTVLTSTGVDGNANGHASYEQSANESEFEVEIEDLDDGAYELRVGGIVRATINVSGEEGEVKFNSPARAGRLPLDFDPRGQRIDIVRNGVVYLTGTL